MLNRTQKFGDRTGDVMLLFEHGVPDTNMVPLLLLNRILPVEGADPMEVHCYKINIKLFNHKYNKLRF